MNKSLLALALTASAMIASPAQAVVNVDGTVPAFGIDYIFFSFAGGNLSIGTTGNGANPLDDPMISVFTDNGSPAGALTGTLIGTDDDNGPGLDALLSLLGLASGNYVLAVGEFNMTEAEARSGIASTPDSPGGYRTTFTSQPDVIVGHLAVPEPATWITMLFGFGAAGAALRRRSKATASA